MSEEGKETETETNPLVDMIGHVSNKDYNSANQIFNKLMGDKVNDTLEAEKVNQADHIFNGVGDEEETSQEVSSEESEQEVETEEQ